MKKKVIILLIIIIILAIVIIITCIMRRERVTAGRETLKYTQTDSVSGLSVSQISFSEWNTPSGLPYSQVPGANLGVTAFQLIDEKHIAFLCNSSSEIIITDKLTGKLTKKWPVSFAPRDFVFDNGFNYVLSEHEVTVYDDTGREIRKFTFPSSVQGVERLSRFNDATYLLLPSGNSLLIENCGTPVTPLEFPGTMTGNGLFIKTQLTGNNAYSLQIQYARDKITEKSFTTDRKTAGVFVVGATENRVILDVQTYISENPVSVERRITLVSMDKDSPESVVCSREVPDCYYVISNRDFYVGPDGNIYNMMTSPRGVFVFSLTETETGNAMGYPSILTENTFPSNEHLIKQD